MRETLSMILPQSLYTIIHKLPTEIVSQVEEIRIRENRPLEVIYQGNYGFVKPSGSLSELPEEGYLPTREDCLKLLDCLTNHSVYTLEEELKRGYITVRGGHRVGLSGKTVLDKGQVKQIREISSFNIRLAREIKDAGKALLPKLLDSSAQTIHHTLIVSPPGQGKTTLIRDVARLLSYGLWPGPQQSWKGLKVGIVDERSELAACVKGIPSFDVGPRTDGWDSCPKAEGMMMMIRSMSPDVIVVDEIGREEDAVAIHEALHAGIRIVATAHGDSFEDMKGRPWFFKLMSDQIFSRYVVLGRTYGLGTVYRIYDNLGRQIDSLLLQRIKSHA